MANDVSKMVKEMLILAQQQHHKLEDLVKETSQDKALAPVAKTAQAGFSQFHKAMRELLKKTG